MPSIRVWGNPLPKETKEALARRFCSDLKSVLKVPIGEVYFNDSETFYVDNRDGFTEHNSSSDAPCYVTLIVNGPERGQEDLSELCKALDLAFRETVKAEKYEVSFIYHPIDGDHVGSNGQLHSLRPPNPRGPN